MIGRNVVQATCKLCDTPVSVVTAIHRGLCRSHSQQERIARRERAQAGRPTVEDLLMASMNATRKSYVRKRPCVTCGTLVRENRSPVARCQACFMRERYGAREKRDMIAVSLRLPATIVNTLREQAEREGQSFTAIVEKTLAKLVN